MLTSNSQHRETGLKTLKYTKKLSKKNSFLNNKKNQSYHFHIWAEWTTLSFSSLVESRFREYSRDGARNCSGIARCWWGQTSCSFRAGWGGFLRIVKGRTQLKRQQRCYAALLEWTMTLMKNYTRMNNTTQSITQKLCANFKVFITLAVFRLNHDSRLCGFAEKIVTTVFTRDS